MLAVDIHSLLHDTGCGWTLKAAWVCSESSACKQRQQADQHLSFICHSEIAGATQETSHLPAARLASRMILA